VKYPVLSSNIKVLMKHSELTAKGFADKFKVTQGAVESYAGGRNKPKLELIEKICNYYGISQQQLLKQRLTPEDLKVTGQVESVTEVKLKAALREIKLLKQVIELLQKRQ
jgi:transcriptional regulator with XRE-family HTH domain